MHRRIDGEGPRRYITNPLVINFTPLSSTVGAHPEVGHIKRERRKESRPGELLAAALDLFAEKGFAATRAEEVAKRAGVSKGTLFLYFSSKEELFKAVVRDNISHLYPAWTTELEAYTGSTPDLLRYSMFTWWERLGNTKASAILKLIMSEAGNFPELALFYQREVVQPGRKLLLRILQRGIDRGEFRPMNLKYGAFSVLAPMFFLVMWKHSLGVCVTDDDRIVPEDFIKAQMDTLLQGMCVREAAPAASPKQKGKT